MIALAAAVVGVALASLIALNAWGVSLLIELRTWVLGSPQNPGMIARIRRLERAVFHEDQL